MGNPVLTKREIFVLFNLFRENLNGSPGGAAHGCMRWPLAGPFVWVGFLCPQRIYWDCTYLVCYGWNKPRVLHALVEGFRSKLLPGGHLGIEANLVHWIRGIVIMSHTYLNLIPHTHIDLLFGDQGKGRSFVACGAGVTRTQACMGMGVLFGRSPAWKGFQRIPWEFRVGAVSHLYVWCPLWFSGDAAGILWMDPGQIYIIFDLIICMMARFGEQYYCLMD